MTFEVTVEGDVRGEPSFRLVCDYEPMSLSFSGQKTTEGISFQIPILKGILPEGMHPARLEVIVGDRLLVPMQLELEFRPTMRAVVESVKVKDHGSIRVESKLKHAPNHSVVKHKAREIIEMHKPVGNPTTKPEGSKPIQTQKKIPNLSDVVRDKAQKR